MTEEASGRVPSAPGSHPSGHAGCAVDGASRFDPSRTMRVGTLTLDMRVLRPALEAMRPQKGIDYFEAWDVTWPLCEAAKQLGFNASYVAGRLLQQERKAGRILCRGSGQWVLCDRDRHRAADETRSGSVERSEIEPGPERSEGIAQLPEDTAKQERG